jgi:hypothetical protein
MDFMSYRGNTALLQLPDITRPAIVQEAAEKTIQKSIPTSCFSNLSTEKIGYRYS